MEVMVVFYAPYAVDGIFSFSIVSQGARIFDYLIAMDCVPLVTYPPIF